MSESLNIQHEQEPYSLELPNPSLVNFTAVEITKVNEDLAWKPATEVSVTHPDGTVDENVDPFTPVFAFKAEDGELTVPIQTAGHIDALHIHGQEPGSQFDYANLTDLFTDVAKKLPEGLASSPDDRFSLSIEMGKTMGKEGVSSQSELVESGTLTQEDVAFAASLREGIAALNVSGDEAAMDEFVDSYAAENPDAKIQFQKVRGGAIVPIVKAPKQDTTELFLAFGPDGKGGKTLFTAAPGRNMPKHPVASQHMNKDGSINQESFKQSADAWFDTVMLVS